MISSSAPRLVVTVTSVTPRLGKVTILDAEPNDTSQYYVRYKRRRDVAWNTIKWEKSSLKPVGSRYLAYIGGLVPYTNYSVEVAPYYVDKDLGPYSMPLTFVTQEDGENLSYDDSYGDRNSENRVTLCIHRDKNRK